MFIPILFLQNLPFNQIDTLITKYWVLNFISLAFLLESYDMLSKFTNRFRRPALNRPDTMEMNRTGKKVTASNNVENFFPVKEFGVIHYFHQLKTLSTKYCALHQKLEAYRNVSSQTENTAQNLSSQRELILSDILSTSKNFTSVKDAFRRMFVKAIQKNQFGLAQRILHSVTDADETMPQNNYPHRDRFSTSCLKLLILELDIKTFSELKPSFDTLFSLHEQNSLFNLSEKEFMEISFQILQRGGESHEALFYLLDKMPEYMNAHHPTFGTGLLHAAVLNHSEFQLEIIQNLVNRGANVNLKSILITETQYSSNGQNFHLKLLAQSTPLIFAAITNNIEASKILLRAGADVNVQNEYTQSSLSYAVQKNNIELTKVLLEYEANYHAIISRCDDAGNLLPKASIIEIDQNEGHSIIANILREINEKNILLLNTIHMNNDGSHPGILPDIGKEIYRAKIFPFIKKV